MKKKIKDLTREERLKICDKYVHEGCEHCPFLLFTFREQSSYCVHHILNVLEREVEYDS